MIKTKLILPAVLALATSLTGASAATSTETNDTDIRSEISVQREEALSEKLESGEITQEQYDKITAAIESGEFRGAWGINAMHGKRGNATELTEEQKDELSAKRAEMLAEKLEVGEITQEQYDEMIAAIESGNFGGFWANRGNIGELTEEQKEEIAEKRNELAENGGFGGFWANRSNTDELTDEQKAQIAEKRAEAAKNGSFGGFGGFGGGMRSNFGSRNN